MNRHQQRASPALPQQQTWVPSIAVLYWPSLPPGMSACRLGTRAHRETRGDRPGIALDRTVNTFGANGHPASDPVPPRLALGHTCHGFSGLAARTLLAACALELGLTWVAGSHLLP